MSHTCLVTGAVVMFTTIYCSVRGRNEDDGPVFDVELPVEPNPKKLFRAVNDAPSLTWIGNSRGVSGLAPTAFHSCYESSASPTKCTQSKILELRGQNTAAPILPAFPSAWTTSRLMVCLVSSAGRPTRDSVPLPNKFSFEVSAAFESLGIDQIGS